jgi:NADH:ubiquinone oxidoreductase subunit 5 (subunit L)/multisubunit Na+/H+ antiporter MnhA subunit
VGRNFNVKIEGGKTPLKVVERGTSLAPTEHNEAPLAMAIPLTLLAFGSVFIGFIFRDAFIGLGSNF